jgi:uncharacterized membrane-anchored protein YitT (DUF2179 family)
MTARIRITKNSVQKTLREYIFMTIGVMIYAFAWVGIIMPADGVGGGASGIALLIYYATGGVAEGGIPIGYSFLVINAILLVAAIIILGAKFGVKTIFCIALTSVVMNLMQAFIPDDLLGLGGDKLLSSILGGATSGLGISLVLMQGGSTGGTDIIAMIINKYRNISYGRVIMAVDVIIIGCSYFIFKDLPTIIYGYVLAAAFSFTADSVLAGNKQSAQIFINSVKYAAIADMITNDHHRGVTMLDGTGWYTQKPTKVLIVVCRKYEANVILQSVKSLDPEAFITMGSVMGVYGKGFETFRR